MDRERIVSSLKTEDSFSIIAHVSPDGDAIGSSLALYNSLKQLGKSCQIFIDDKLPQKYSYLPGFGSISSKDAETECENVVVLDCGDIDRCGSFKKIAENAGFCINIDHHITNKGYGMLNLVFPKASSVGEILYDIICDMGVTINETIAQCIYTSIASDTGGFRYSNTSPHTHSIAGELIKTGIDFSFISSRLFDERSVTQSKLLAAVLGTLQIYFGGRVALLYLNREMLDKCGATDEDSEDFVNYARDIDSAEVGIMVKQKDDGSCRVSLRSKSKADVRKVAEAFSGGGHVRAAGCTINAPLNEAINILLRELEGMEGIIQ
jgi:phosphoesterase RecJ-like protein